VVQFPWQLLNPNEPVLVVAPHSDDETLGCGGAIALLCAHRCPVYVLVITDGTQSHPRSLKYPAPALQQLRQQETRAALSTLGMASGAITFFLLPDGELATVMMLPANQSLCRNYLKTLVPKTIFLPWRYDPHPDHRATWQLMTEAIVDCGITSRLIEYPIWDWDIHQSKHLPNSNQISAWRLDIKAVLGKKQRAIAAYQSQTTNLINDDPEGFRLTPTMLAHFTQPWEVYFEEVT
jgi:LmbE family N-acetylglucosaminyl deacetylase